MKKSKSKIPTPEDFKPGDKELLVYLASPFFNPHQIQRVEDLTVFLETIPGIKVFSPMRDGTVCPADASAEIRKAVYELDIGVIRECDMLVAILDDKDTGTTYEMGFAAALHVPVVGLAYNKQVKMNLMLSEGFYAYVKDRSHQEVLRRFVLELLLIKVRLTDGIALLQQKDQDLAKEIQDVGQSYQARQTALKEDGAKFDKVIHDGYINIATKYRKETIFVGAVE